MANVLGIVLNACDFMSTMSPTQPYRFLNGGYLGITWDRHNPKLGLMKLIWATAQEIFIYGIIHKR